MLPKSSRVGLSFAPRIRQQMMISGDSSKKTGNGLRPILQNHVPGEAAAESIPKLTPEELHNLAQQALKVIPARAAYYAPLIGVTYGRITIRNQTSRWGSCSSKGNLNFNCLLMLAPPEVLDSVVVHELCHRREMNHSQKFYAEVLRVFPTYRTQEKWLKEHGGELLKRLRD